MSTMQEAKDLVISSYDAAMRATREEEAREMGTSAGSGWHADATEALHSVRGSAQTAIQILESLE